MSSFRKALKPWVLPLAMVLGVVFHNHIGAVAFLSRYFIFVMLLITYCRVSVREFRPTRFTWTLLLVQMAMAVGVYFLLKPINEDIAQATFICLYAPTATAAPVVTGMLGGSIARVATYSMICHVVVALSAPVLLTLMGGAADMAFAASVGQIAYNVLPVILGPLIIALAMQRWAPRAHHALATHQGLSFYIWAVSLLIVVGNSVSFVVSEPRSDVPVEGVMAALSLLACLGQFYVGRRLGLRHGDAVAGAQALGQKNTVLAIWLALTFLNPITSVGPAAYVVWHNVINSYQIYRKSKHSDT